MSGRGNQIWSLEAALEEERKDVERLISNQQNSQRRTHSAGPRPISPYVANASTTSPTATPVRSMLDVETPLPSRPAPRSMLDIDAPAPPPGSINSPAPSIPAIVTHHRSMSDAATNPVPDLGPRSPPLPSPRSPDPTASYKFSDILPTNVGQSLPNRRGSTTGSRSGSLAEALRGTDISNLVLPADLGRGLSLKKSKSKSPSSRFSLRSSSPYGTSSRVPQSPTSFTMDNGQVVDMNNAYLRLTNANLLRGGSSLASLPRRKMDYADGSGRIEKDNLSPYGELLPDESEDDGLNSSDEEDERGRKLTTDAESSSQAKSLLAALDDDRKRIAIQRPYRSLFDPPDGSVMGSAAEKGKQKAGKEAVQPSTSFDQDISALQNALDADHDADKKDIKDAQNLQLSLTPIISTPEIHRSVRLIYRGDYHKTQREAEDGPLRPRKYLVATDLSDESTHALEWAIGTVLRDGDTLIAIYCMDEEASGSIDAGSLVPDEPKATKEQALTVNALNKNISSKPGQSSGSSGAFNFHRSFVTDSGSNTSSPAPGSGGRGRLEEERHRAMQGITERVSKLLRKTQLQVRVIVEAIQCKNPKHLITEVIDLLNPTLVILGSRGRSALKGTLLGSFSNYLVTKSSVPVMVARKRLRKKSKYQPPPLRQVNNLANPDARSLETARID
ncbi:hypothetical protein GGR56DRAFT_637148 [Xylariaceae sp. FL0804]|nr:hypothetical protein GGR56DRAFT_637148 [Xylariaceae sp. FL0804]